MSELPESFQTAPLAEIDPEIADTLRARARPPAAALELIASENFVSAGRARGHGLDPDQQVRRRLPGKRYYGGCEVVDVAEQLAIDRAKQLFGAEHANVQPHSGAQANMAVYSR